VELVDVLLLSSMLWRNNTFFVCSELSASWCLQESERFALYLLPQSN
jgi:hypothetical protein